MFALAATIGCGEDPVESKQDASEVVAIDTIGHLGRVHVILQPSPDELEPEPQLQIQARFVEYRNVAEAFVRARAKLPVPVWEQLEVGQCVASSSLLPADPPQPEGEPELSMIDAGDLRVTIGTRDVVVPLVLIPDILPWLSGVEYVHVDDRMPELAVEPDGSFPLAIRVDGTPELGLDPFQLGIRLPAALSLQGAGIGEGRLTIDWQPPGEPTQAILLRLQAFQPSEGIPEPSGEELTCLVPDSGRASLEIAALEGAGLATGAAMLRVAASRFESRTVDTGAYEGVELIVEMRDQRTLPLLAPPTGE
ncbi:hypothetical protein ACNOYE_12215 [Nannocystaceae bacterium ST9]